MQLDPLHTKVAHTVQQVMIVQIVRTLKSPSVTTPTVTLTLGY